MKKLLGIAASLVLIVIAANAQSDKKEPPPPPPKPKEEVKYKVIEEKIKNKKPPVITVTGKKADEFYTRNPTVSEISRQGNVIILKMKDGTTEKYDTSTKEEDKSFTDKYGRSPIPPPPPPPKVVKNTRT